MKSFQIHDRYDLSWLDSEFIWFWRRLRQNDFWCLRFRELGIPDKKLLSRFFDES